MVKSKASSHGKQLENDIATAHRALGQQVYVKQNARVMGRSGVKHEIDVLVSFAFASYSWSIAIEAKNFRNKRKVGLPAVRNFESAIRDLRVEKGVVVSSNGFTRPAYIYATNCNIDLRTAEQFNLLKLLEDSMIETSYKVLHLCDRILDKESLFLSTDLGAEHVLNILRYYKEQWSNIFRDMLHKVLKSSPKPSTYFDHIERVLVVGYISHLAYESLQSGDMIAQLSDWLEDLTDNEADEVMNNCMRPLLHSDGAERLTFFKDYPGLDVIATTLTNRLFPDMIHDAKFAKFSSKAFQLIYKLYQGVFFTGFALRHSYRETLDRRKYNDPNKFRDYLLGLLSHLRRKRTQIDAFLLHLRRTDSLWADVEMGRGTIKVVDVVRITLAAAMYFKFDYDDLSILLDDLSKQGWIKPCLGVFQEMEKRGIYYKPSYMEIIQLERKVNN